MKFLSFSVKLWFNLQSIYAKAWYTMNEPIQNSTKNNFHYKIETSKLEKNDLPVNRSGK